MELYLQKKKNTICGQEEFSQSSDCTISEKHISCLAKGGMRERRGDGGPEHNDDVRV
jgi:hypothetical protein